MAPEAYLCAKALSALKEFKVDVLTIDPAGLGFGIDNSLDDYVNGHFHKIYRVKPPNWLCGKMFAWLRYLSPFPDRFRVLNPYMVKAALALDLSSYHVMLSWSQWHSVHLAAANIKKNFPSIPWVAHMSDPWGDNPFLPKLPGFAPLQRFLEKGVIQAADQIHFTTEATRRLVMQKYPRELFAKAYVLPHAYEPDFYGQNLPARDQSTYTLRYLGNFYGPRNPLLFTRSVAALLRARPDMFEDVCIEFFGRWIGNPAWQPDIEGVPNDLMSFKAPVGYMESLRLMRHSDMLLILDAPFEVSVFFPSKLVDYIGAGRPLLAFTPEGASAEIVRKIGGMVFSPASVQSISLGLVEALEKLKSGSEFGPKGSLGEEYSTSCVAAQYDDVLSRLVEARGT
jgi:glycosyltransferase involved in cell wall biosynthesis